MDKSVGLDVAQMWDLGLNDTFIGTSLNGRTTFLLGQKEYISN
jgi:hypothetical protein